MIGWGVRANNDKAESLKYSFELGRMPVQLSMEQSRHKPSAEQMDDWRTYKKYKNVRVKDINQSNPNDKAVIVSWGSRDSSISSLRRDSGYSSEPKRRSSRSVNSSGSKEAM